MNIIDTIKKKKTNILDKLSDKDEQKQARRREIDQGQGQGQGQGQRSVP